MDLNLNTAERAFQQEVRDFVRDNLPGAVRNKVEKGLHLVKEDYLVWQDVLARRGWLVPSWPVEYGGTGWTPIERHLFEAELAAGSAPRVIPFGPVMVGPVIIEFGSPQQKQSFLPRIADSRDW